MSGKLFMAFLSILVLTCLAFPQANSKSATEKPPSRSEITISLISRESEYELKSGFSIPVVVRVQNFSEQPVKIKQRPVFDIVRLGSGKTNPHIGESYTGRSNPSTKKSGVICLNHGEYTEFTFDLAKIEVKDVISSFDLWDDILKELEPGKYFLNAWIVIEYQGDSIDDYRPLISNGITVVKNSK